MNRRNHSKRQATDEHHIDELVEKLKALERKVPRDIEWRVAGLREDVENYLDPYHDSGNIMVAYNDLYEALMESGAMEGLERELDKIGDLVDTVHFGDFGKESRKKKGRRRYSNRHAMHLREKWRGQFDQAADKLRPKRTPPDCPEYRGGGICGTR